MKDLSNDGQSEVVKVPSVVVPKVYGVRTAQGSTGGGGPVTPPEWSEPHAVSPARVTDEIVRRTKVLTVPFDPTDRLPAVGTPQGLSALPGSASRRQLS
jgi:hypothetical protein